MYVCCIQVHSAMTTYVSSKSMDIDEDGNTLCVEMLDTTHHDGSVRNCSRTHVEIVAERNCSRTPSNGLEPLHVGYGCRRPSQTRLAPPPSPIESDRLGFARRSPVGGSSTTPSRWYARYIDIIQWCTSNGRVITPGRLGSKHCYNVSILQHCHTEYYTLKSTRYCSPSLIYVG